MSSYEFRKIINPIIVRTKNRPADIIGDRKMLNYLLLVNIEVSIINMLD